MATQKEITRQLAGMVATELDATGYPFKVRTSWEGADWCIPLDNAHNGATLFLTTEKYGMAAERVELSVQYPDGVRDVYPTPETFRITVKRDRGPAVIAKEITRRLLPDYLPELKRVREAIDRHNAGVSKRDDVRKRLAAALPGSSVDTSRHGREVDTVTLAHTEATGYGTARPWHGGERVDLDLHNLPVNVAEALLKLLAHYGTTGK